MSAQNATRLRSVGHAQAAGSELAQEVVVEGDPVQDRLPEPPLIGPGGREGRIFGGQAVSLQQEGEGSRRQEQPARPLGECGPTVA